MKNKTYPILQFRSFKLTLKMKYFKYFFSFFMLLACTFNVVAQFEIRVENTVVANGGGACIPIYIGSSSFEGVGNFLSLTNVHFSWNTNHFSNAVISNLNPSLGFNIGSFTFDTDGGGMIMDFVFLECNEANNNAQGISIPSIDIAPIYLFDICFGSIIGNDGDCLSIDISNPIESPPIHHRSFTFNAETGTCADVPVFFPPISGCVYIGFEPEEVLCDPVSDSLVLVAFYHATGGENWDDNTNWLVEGQEIGTWNLITTNTEGCVIEGLFFNNNLVGHIPPELGSLSHLMNFAIGHNQITGNIPSELGNLSNLRLLALVDNQLTGSIPPELGNLSNLAQLILTGNQLSGNIPAELGNLSSLTALSLILNQLTGSIPSEFGNLSNSSSLLFSGNQLTGGIPRANAS